MSEARSIMHSSFCPAVICLAVSLAGCGKNEPSDPAERQKSQPGTAWQTREWPVTRGGVHLHGRVIDPVPRRVAVEWTFSAQAAITSEAVVGAGMIVFGDDDGGVTAVSLESRKPRWRVETRDSIHATPLIHGGRVFAGSNDGTFRALQVDDGSLLWEFKGGDKFPTGAVPVPAADAEARLLVNGYDGLTRCLRAADGHEIWRHEAGDPINGSPALLDDRRMVFGGCDAVIHGIDIADGSPWRKLETEAYIITSLAAWDGMVYLINHANQLVAADLEQGKVLWSLKNDDIPYLTSPGVDEERVYVGSRDRHLHAVDRLTGTLAWKSRTGGRIAGAPLVFDDAVVFASADGRLYAVDKRDGAEIWRLDLGEPLLNAPAFADGRIVIGGADGTLFVVGEGGDP